MNKYKREQKCSFCGKEPHEVEQLLAGPEAFICNECFHWQIQKVNELC